MFLKANQFDHILIITKGYDINSKLEHIPSAKKARNCLPEDITFHYPEMNLFYKVKLWVVDIISATLMSVLFCRRALAPVSGQ